MLTKFLRTLISFTCLTVTGPSNQLTSGYALYIVIQTLSKGKIKGGDQDLIYAHC
jgi:hypothetical protein